MNFSLTWTSAIVLVVVQLAKVAGVPIDESDITTTITTIVQVASMFGILYGRYRIGDISLLGKKK